MCRRIEENLCRSCINIDCFTDGRRRRNSVVGISQRVGNKLRAFATISDGISDGITDGQSPTAITDGIVSSVSHRELEKNYGLLPQFPTASPTAFLTQSPTGNHRRHHRRNSSFGISQRLWKKLWAFATISDGLTDGNHRRKLHIPKRLSESLLPTELSAVNFRR